jgi:hypothetical protein
MMSIKINNSPDVVIIYDEDFINFFHFYLLTNPSPHEIKKTRVQLPQRSSSSLFSPKSLQSGSIAQNPQIQA